MSDLSPEEERRIIESPPKGTFALIIVYGVILITAWLLLYFGRFMAHGPVS